MYFTLSDSFSSVELSTAALPGKLCLPRTSSALHSVKRAPFTIRSSTRSPSGFPSGYSGFSPGNSISSVCSAAYLQSCPKK